MFTRVMQIGTLVMGFGLIPLYAADDAKGKDEPDKMPASPAKADVQDGLEIKNWALEKGGNDADLKVLAPKGNQGNPMLMIDYLGGRKPRVDLRRWSSFAANEKGKINLHVYSA